MLEEHKLPRCINTLFAAACVEEKEDKKPRVEERRWRWDERAYIGE
jgi:hypothetical protein